MKLETKKSELLNKLNEVKGIFETTELATIETEERNFTSDNIQETIKGIELMDYTLFMLVDDDNGINPLIELLDIIIIKNEIEQVNYEHITEQNLKEYAYDEHIECINNNLTQNELNQLDSINFVYYI